MELSTDILDGIQILGDSVHVKESSYPLTLEFIFGSILFGHIEPGDIGVKPAVLKQLHASVVTLLLEAAKHNIDVTSISPVLEDCKFAQDRINTFNDYYKKYKTDLQILLSSTGFSPAHIVDIDWRLDYCIKNRQLDGVDEATYTVALKTEQCGQQANSNLQFSCTQEQLQDLVGKLKDACKSVERSAQL